MESFQSGDVEKLLAELSEKSTSPDKTKSILRTFLNFSSESKDVANEMFDKGVVEVLVKLFISERGKSFRRQTVNTLVSLSFQGDEFDEGSISDVAVAALSNIYSKSNLKVFLQSISGIRDIAAFMSNSDTSSSSPSATAPSLSVSSSAALLERTATLLSSPSLKDMDKFEVLDTLLQVVNLGVLNEAADFVRWRQSKSQSQARSPAQSPLQAQDGRGREGGDGGGGRGSGFESDESKIPAVRFFKAFEAFTDAVNRIAETKKRTGLGCTAERISAFIQEKTFFPTFVSLTSTREEPEKLPMKFPLKFLINAGTSSVTNSGSKLSWNRNEKSTHFVDLEMSAGIFKMTLARLGDMGCSTDGLGLSSKEHLKKLEKSALPELSSGTCSLSYNQIRCGSSVVVSGSTLFSYPGKTPTVFDLELDADKHVLYFFVDGTQVPHCITNIPPSVYFAITGESSGLSVELEALTKLASSSANSSVSQHAWR